MSRFFSKAITFVLGLILLCATVLPENAVFAEHTPSKPVVSVAAVFSGKLELRLDNHDEYEKATKFEIWVDGVKTSSTTIEKLADKDYVFNICGGVNYFAPDTKYTVKIKAVSGSQASSFSKTVSFTTAGSTYYYSAKGRTYYKAVNGSLTEAGTLPRAVYVKAVLSDKHGVNCEGKNTKTNKGEYILITEGKYKGFYLSVSQVRRKTDEFVQSLVPAAPKLTESFVSADKIGVGITNLSDYKSGTVFNVYVGGKLLKTVKLASVERDGYISVYSDPDRYLKKSQSCKITVEADYHQLTAKTVKNFTTGKTTYFRLVTGTAVYTLSDGKFTSAGKIGYDCYGEGVRTDAKGKDVAGRAVSVKPEYVKLTSGDYAGKYVKASAVGRITEKTAKSLNRQVMINKVVAYVKSNVGGAYVSCGERYRATDCSGLTMLAYRQVGVKLPHSAYGQMCLGKRVSASEMQPGDIIIANGYNHAMMYVGNGMVVHAMNSRDGIRMQAASTAMYYNPVNAIVRII